MATMAASCKVIYVAATPRSVCYVRDANSEDVFHVGLATKPHV